MKKAVFVATALAVLGIPAAAQERNVLVEMFTNSHCGLCPSAHYSLKSYANSSPNASRIRYIYYHVPFPYSDDPLAQVATSDAAGRNQYYGPFSATPVTFFDGVNQGTSYGSWPISLNNQVGLASPLKITVVGSRNDADVTVSATIEAVGTPPAGALAIHFVIVENVSYTGRNGVTPQDFVMRKMIAGPSGDPFTIGTGETKIVEKTSPLSNVTSMNSAGFVVFVQEVGTRAILQSDYIPYGVLTGVEDNKSQPATFRLEQNYPNPFNPETRIQFTLADPQSATLKVFDLLGREVAVLVNEKKEAGVHEVKFYAGGLASGAYFYRLQAGGFVQTRKLILMK